MNRRMNSLAPWARTALGVDTDGAVPVAVQARRGYAGRVQYSRVADVPAALAAGKGAMALACGLPPGVATTTWLSAPLTSSSKTVRVLPTLLDMALPFALEDCVSAFSTPVRLRPDGSDALPLKGGGRPSGMAALAVAVRRHDVEQRLAALAADGLDPHTLDHEGLALWTQAGREVEPAEGEGLRVVLMARESFVLVAMGGDLVFWSAHRIRYADSAAMERTLRIPLATVAQGRFADMPVRWIWAGDLEAVAPLRMRLETALPGSSVTVAEPECFLARALATRALVRGPLRFNLRKGAFTHPQGVRTMRDALYRRAAVLAVLAVGLLAVNGFHAHRVRQRQEQAEARFQEGIRRVAGYPVAAVGEHALLIAERELAARQETESPLETAFLPPLLEVPGVVLAAVEAAGGHVYALRAVYGRFGLRGEVPSAVMAQALVEKLELPGCTLSLAEGEPVADAFEFVMKGRAEVQP